MQLSKNIIGFSLLEVVLAVGILGISFPILISLSAKSIDNNRSTIHNLEIQNAYKNFEAYVIQNTGFMTKFDNISSQNIYFYRNNHDEWKIAFTEQNSTSIFKLSKIDFIEENSAFSAIYTYSIQKCTPSGNIFPNTITKYIKICDI